MPRSAALGFEWKFTRRDLRRLLSRLEAGELECRLAA